MNEFFDSGLLCLTVIAQLFERKTNPQQLKHLSGKGTELFDETDILRLAKTLDLKAKAVQTDMKRLVKTPLPAIARDKNGEFFILAKFAPDKALIHRPNKGAPELLSAEELEKTWTERLILFTSRSNIKNLWRRFDISWFIPAVLKYKKLFGEVLLSSLFLQIFALVSPLLFQVIIDKVLVHHSSRRKHVVYHSSRLR